MILPRKCRVMSIPIICPKNYDRCGVKVKYDPHKLFVLMPFREKEAPQSLFHDVLISLPGWTVHRADSDLSKPDIWCKICANIQESRAIIADLSGSNPNVFLELGLAWGLGKPFILLTQEREKLPFDTKRYYIIEYERVSTNSAFVKSPRKVQDQILSVLKDLPEKHPVQSIDYVTEELDEMIKRAKKGTTHLWRREDDHFSIHVDDSPFEDRGIKSEDSKPPYWIMISLLRAYPDCRTLQEIASETGLGKSSISRIITGKRHDHSQYFSKCKRGFRLSDDGLYYFIEMERVREYANSVLRPNE